MEGMTAEKLDALTEMFQPKWMRDPSLLAVAERMEKTTYFPPPPPAPRRVVAVRVEVDGLAIAEIISKHQTK